MFNGKFRIALLGGMLILVSLFVFACGQASSSGGKITGKVLAADGVTTIAGASVSLKTDSSKSTTTGSDGSFTLQGDWITAGTYTLLAEIGSFKLEFSVTVASDGATTDVGNKEIDPADPGATIPKLAVIQGSWDEIETIISSLGYTYSTIYVTDVNNNYTGISTFDAIFIDCGTTGSSLTSSGEANLKAFVETHGGSVYASDYAGDYIEKTWPSAVVWYGGSVDAAKVGVGSTTLDATVVDVNLQTVLGKSTASIFYDLGSWVIISSEGTGTTVLLKGDPLVYSTYSVGASGVRASSVKAASTTITNKPLAIKFQPGGALKGTVIYTTFHNEAQETLVTPDAKKILQNFIFSL